jgi:hypothetical protein
MKDSDIIRNRKEIKEQLPKFYDYHWEFRDEGRFFDVQIPHLKSHDFDIDSEIIFSGSSALIQSYCDLIINISLSWAANKTANDIDDESLANYFRFRIRNLHTKQSVRDFFRFLDYAVFHLNELSLGKLINKKPKYVNYSTLKSEIKNEKINYNDVKDIIIQGIEILTENDGGEFIKKFRDIETHRFPLGIDCILYPFSRSNVDIRLDEKYGRVISIGGYNLYGTPDISFPAMEPILKALGDNAKKIIQGFCNNGLIAQRG